MIEKMKNDFERIIVFYLETARCNGADLSTEEPEMHQVTESLKHPWPQSVKKKTF